MANFSSAKLASRFACALIAAAGAGTAFAEDERRGRDTEADKQHKQQASAEQARIAFANLGGIRDWRAVDRDTLYVEGRNRQWYRAELFGPCIGLDFATRIGFEFEPSGSFDRFSSVIVDGRECPLKSLVESEPPSSGTRKSAGQPAKADTARSATAPAGAKASDGSAGQSSAEPASIPFASIGGIENWRAIDDDTLYIEGRNRQWYRAELFAPCPGVQFETAIGFVVEPTGSFDRFSSIIVDGRECHLKSLTEGQPPGKPDRG